MTNDEWVDSSTMAAALGISLKTLHIHRATEGEGAFLESGVHYRRKAPSKGSPLVWHREKTTKAWEFACSGAGS